MINNAQTFEDSLKVNFTIMTSLVVTSKLKDALDLGLAILSKLGEKFPTEPLKEQIEQETRDTLSMVTNLSDEAILNYRITGKAKKEAAMIFLAKLQYVAYFLHPVLHHLSILRIIQISMLHGELFLCWTTLSVSYVQH